MRELNEIILTNKDLNIYEKHIILYLNTLTFLCFNGSKSDLAEKLNLSESTIARTLKKLRKLNYIYYEYRTKKQRKIILNINHIKNIFNKEFLENQLKKNIPKETIPK